MDNIKRTFKDNSYKIGEFLGGDKLSESSDKPVKYVSARTQREFYPFRTKSELIDNEDGSKHLTLGKLIFLQSEYQEFNVEDLNVGDTVTLNEEV